MHEVGEPLRVRRPDRAAGRRLGPVRHRHRVTLVNDPRRPFVRFDERRRASVLGSLVAEPTREREGASLGVADERADNFRRHMDLSLDASYRLAAVILNDRIEAEDAVHDAAVSAWRAFDDLRDPDRFDAWFRRIVVNGCRDRLRARARQRVVDVGRELAEAEHPRVRDASDAIAARDALDRALAGLEADHQVVVAMRFHADLTVPAIADALGIPEGTVKSRLHHALSRLRATMTEADR
jgi:RNA polymerase sigma-70 factor (ECF subfamily)